MKTSELRVMSPVDLQKELQSLLREKFNMRMQSSTGQPVQTHRIASAKKDIARIKTILREQAIAGKKP